MPRNGSGAYSLPAGNPVVTGTTISSTVHNNTMSDLATALTQSIASTGVTTPSANLPMGGFKLTGLAAGSASTDSARVGQLGDARTFTGPITMSGASVIDANATVAAHATTAAVWLLGNYVTLTGSATVFTDVADAPQAGAEVELYCNAAHTFTNNANFIVDGGGNFVAEVGDRVLLRAQSTSVFTVHPRKANGTAVVASSFRPGMAANRYYTYPFIATTAARTIAAADRLYGIPVNVSEANTFTKIGINVTNGVGGNARLGIYNIDSDGLPSTLVLDAGVVSIATSGEKEIAISQSLSAGWYYLAAVFSAATSDVSEFGTVTGGSFFSGGISSATDLATYVPYVAHTYGALPTPFGSPTLASIVTAHPLLWIRI